jgi:chromosome segregation ATPase
LLFIDFYILCSNDKISKFSFLFKELFRNNSYLLDEKQELEYKLNKTLDMSQNQIKDLETTIDSLNQQLKDVKDKSNLEIEDLRSQMESMESQIRSEKTFIESQTIEREQERDEYEAKIKELKDYINMRDIQTADNEQAALNKVCIYFNLFFYD